MKPRKLKLSVGERVFNGFNYTLLTSLMLVTAYPFIFIVLASFSDPLQIISHRGLLLAPKGFQLEAYKIVLENPMLLTSYLNTIFYVIAGTSINLFFTSIGAYILSRKHFLIRNQVMFIIAFTMFFSGGLIPSYLLIQSLGIYNTRWVLMLPRAIVAWNLIIMRTSFASVPASLEESAKLDGAREFTVLFRIILPLSMPVVAVMILFYGVSHWNAWFDAMVYLQKRELYPLQLLLREILIGSTQLEMLTDVTDSTRRPGMEILIRYATIIVATLPVLCIYPFLQKYFVKGVMVGAIKA